MNITTTSELNGVGPLQQLVRYLLGTIILLALSACGGGGGGTSETKGEVGSAQERTGIFTDSPVQGLGYSIQGSVQLTDASGRFRYVWDEAENAAEEITRFYLGALFLGEVTGKAVVTPMEIFGASSTNDARVVNLLRLLQTLDSNDDPTDGIDISPLAQQQFSEELIVDWSSDIFSNSPDLRMALETAKPGTEVVSAENAVAHFVETLEALPEVELYTVGGASSGLIGNVELEVSGGERITVSPASSSFNFSTKFISGASYGVTIVNALGAQTCQLQGASGSIATNNIQNVELSCEEVISADEYNVGGNVSGLIGNLRIVNTSTSEELLITQNGSFDFTERQAEGTFYSASITENPAEQTCTFNPQSSASGEMPSGDVSSIQISCSDNPAQRFFVSGSLSGLDDGQTIALSLNGGQAITFDGNGFSFAEGLQDNSTYSVTVVSKPVYYTCLTERTQGDIDMADINDVSIDCSHDTYDIGGEVSGHSGLVTVFLSENGLSTKQTTANVSDSAYLFSEILDGTSYSISTEIVEGSDQTCEVANESSSLSGSDITNANITCSDLPRYAIGGTVSGLSGSLVLRNNGLDEKTVLSSGRYQFDAQLLQGESYAVEVIGQPVGQICTIALDAEDGTVDTTAVDSVDISCQSITFSVGGSAGGHNGNLTVNVSVEGQVLAPLNVSAQETSFSLGQLNYGQSIAMSVEAPAGQTCEIQNGVTQSLTQDLSATITCGNIATHTLTTSVTGLNANDSLELSINGEIVNRGNGSANQTLIDNTALSISISNAPIGYSCSVGAFTSPITSAQSVSITCIENSYTLSGTVLGLNGADQVSIEFSGETAQSYSASNNTFSFSRSHGSNFALISDGSLKYNCAIDGGNLTNVTASDTSMVVRCNAPTYLVSGSVRDHDGTVTVSYEDQYGLSTSQQIPVGLSNFEFTGIFNGADYQITSSIDAATNQSCPGSNTSGTVNNQSINNVSFGCTSNPTYTIGGEITGLARGSVTLVNTIDGSDTDLKAFSAAGTFTMNRALFIGQSYSFAVQDSPLTQTCSVKSGGQGTVSGLVESVQIECIDFDQYTVTTQVNGLENGDTINISINSATAQAQGNGSLTTDLYAGQSYELAITGVPAMYTCAPLTSSITSVMQDQSVTVTCSVNEFELSGSVTGLLGADTVALTFEGQAPASYSNNQAFSFQRPYNSNFSVSDSSDKYDCEIDGGDLQNIQAPTSNVSVFCVVNESIVSITATGLNEGEELALQINGTLVGVGGSPTEITVPYGSPLNVAGVIPAQ